MWNKSDTSQISSENSKITVKFPQKQLSLNWENKRQILNCIVSYAENVLVVMR